MLPTQRRPIHPEMHTYFTYKNIVSSSGQSFNQKLCSTVIFVSKYRKEDDFMATAKKLSSGSWRCQVYSHTEEVIQPDGSVKKKRIYKSFTCATPGAKGKRECERMAAEWAVEKEHHTQTTDMLLSEAYDKYISLRSAVISPATLREYKRSAKKDLQGLMSCNISKLTQEMIQRAINEEALSHSPKSVRNMHGLLSAVLGIYRPDFTLRTDLPNKVRPSIYVPTDKEVETLIKRVSGTQMEIPVLLAAFGPMRRSEICALTSDQIDGNIVHVDRAIVLNENYQWVIKKPKSYAGDRYITFPDFVINKIDGRKGRIVSLNPAQISDRFPKILKECNLPHFRFHDLRHYSASIQHALGIPDSYIMQRGGWGNDGVLKSVYRHTLQDMEQKMSYRANKHFEDLCNTKCNTKTESA